MSKNQVVKTKKTKNTAAKPSPKTDRRILRTRDMLGDALVALIGEKNFDEITVQEVLERAGVGDRRFMYITETRTTCF